MLGLTQRNPLTSCNSLKFAAVLQFVSSVRLGPSPEVRALQLPSFSKNKMIDSMPL